MATQAEPDFALDALIAILRQLQAGNGVSIAALHTDLTTFDAAKLPNLSQPHLIKLCETGAIAFHIVGTHRRLRLLDVLAYRDQQDAASHQRPSTTSPARPRDSGSATEPDPMTTPVVVDQSRTLALPQR